MIMSLNLETNRIGLIEFHYAGIIIKNGDTPVFIQLLCRSINGLSQQIIKLYLLTVKVHIDTAFKRFVNSICAPHLRMRF